MIGNAAALCLPVPNSTNEVALYSRSQRSTRVGDCEYQHLIGSMLAAVIGAGVLAMDAQP
jgi:hypothetical protein